MSDKLKSKLKPGKSRTFLSKDFESLRRDLIEHARIFFPDKIQDFSEPSVGGLLVDLAASVGDTMAYYLDHQFRELDPNNAVEIENITTHLQNAGVKISGASPAVAEITVTVTVPVDQDPETNDYIPRMSAIPVVLETSTFRADNGTFFSLTEDLNFAKKDVLGNLVANKNFKTKQGAQAPSTCELSLKTFAVSGLERQENIPIPDNHVPFRELTLSSPDVSEILFVRDSDGNKYYEVESLSQDSVFIPTDNLSRHDFDTVSKSLEVIHAPRRFIKRTSLSTRKTTLRFGSGNTQVLDDDILPDPSDLSLSLYGKKSFTKFSIDPKSLINTQTLGLSPRATTLTVRYRHGGGLSHNVDSGTIKNIQNLSIEFRNNPTPQEALAARQSIKCNNTGPGGRAKGGMNAPTIRQLRALIQSARNSQSRTVTREDLIARVYSLPSEFGRVYRIGLADNVTNPLALQMFVLGLDRNGKIDTCPDTLKINLRKYLNEFRLVADAIDILDGGVINISIQYEVYLEKEQNKSVVIQKINSKIADAMNIDFYQIDQPLIYDDFTNIIINTPGVISLTDLSIRPVIGMVENRIYSDRDFQVVESTKNGIIRPPLGHIFELKYPEFDIKGTAI